MSWTEDVKKRLAGATPGEWSAILPDDPRGQPSGMYCGLVALVSASDKPLAVVTDGRDCDPDEWQANTVLIAHAPGDLQRLLDLVEKADALADLLRDAAPALLPMSPVEAYDALAEQFYRETGYMAPGKSVPMAMAPGEAWERERAPAWDRWRREHSKRLAERLSDAVAAYRAARGDE